MLGWRVVSFASSDVCNQKHFCGIKTALQKIQHRTSRRQKLMSKSWKTSACCGVVENLGWPKKFGSLKKSSLSTSRSYKLEDSQAGGSIDTLSLQYFLYLVYDLAKVRRVRVFTSYWYYDKHLKMLQNRSPTKSSKMHLFSNFSSTVSHACDIRNLVFILPIRKLEEREWLKTKCKQFAVRFTAF